MIAWRYAADSNVGLLRDGNEDAAFAGRRLLAVADGMGGHAAGEVASAAVIAALEQLDELGVNAGDPQEALREAVEEANANLRDMVAADTELQGMGTTVTAVLTDGAYVWLAHVGDSRAYLLREGALTQLTRDHTFVQQLVDEGRIAPEDASTHPQRNFITRALDGRAGIDIDLDRLDLRPGDRLLLCSDGLSGVVSDESLADVLNDATPEEAVRRLIDLALRGGGPDNITCIVADAIEGTPDTGNAVSVVGAASDEPAMRAEDGSPAARAAALRSRRATPTAADEPPRRQRAKRSRRRRTLIVTAAVLAVVVAAAAAGWSWTQDQFYVGTAGGDVAIYQGVEGSLAGLDLSKVKEPVPLAVSALPDFERKRVEDGIAAADLEEARAIVSRLQAVVTPSPTPTPSPSPTPKPTPKATKSPSQSRSP
jgi:protein phosphatase